MTPPNPAFHAIIFLDDNGVEVDRFTCDGGQSVLHAMAAKGRKGIPLGCRGGGCGVCKIKVLSGQYAGEIMSRAHVGEEDERDGVGLACRIRPRSDLMVRVLGKINKAWGQSAPAIQKANKGRLQHG
ncbi:MAG: 2Fe-2S iron-sulfur cluster binding domain-containing protein [Rhodospirillum sp.]|nr:2Fe-2S iron-sulfur cluster binding domain-containing protein [Rhodospirillum sp.]MCF8488183.1 2Fe-2S iron-sulfur cluster binding domain-containing protein [Rhodospirillum sp.]